MLTDFHAPIPITTSISVKFRSRLQLKVFKMNIPLRQITLVRKYCVQHSPSLEAGIYLAIQDIPHY